MRQVLRVKAARRPSLLQHPSADRRAASRATLPFAVCRSIPPRHAHRRAYPRGVSSLQDTPACCFRFSAYSHSQQKQGVSLRLLRGFLQICQFLLGRGCRHTNLRACAASALCGTAFAQHSLSYLFQLVSLPALQSGFLLPLAFPFADFRLLLAVLFAEDFLVLLQSADF